MEFSHPTRRDDLIALCYLLLTFLNQGDFPILGEQTVKDKSDIFDQVLEFKKKNSLSYISQNLHNFTLN